MALASSATADAYGRPGMVSVDSTPADRLASAVSWGAILAGAAAAAVLSLILLVLGIGLGLSSLSPYANSGARAATLGFAAIAWITVTQIMASGLGGYLAGRLRTRWIAVHTDEVYFRDTAHGFLAWAIASLLTAALLSSVLSSVIGGTVQAGATVAAGGVAASGAAVAGGAQAMGERASGRGVDGGAASARYFVDSLFRRDAPAAPVAALASPNAAAVTAQAPEANDQAAPTGEVLRILAQSSAAGALPAEDLRYISQLVAQRTGLSQQDAEKRVTDTYGRMQAKLREAEAAAKDAADKARKASAYAALWLFVSLLAGAFAASLAATYGGRERDA